MEDPFYTRVLSGLKKLLLDKSLSQASFAEMMGTSPSQFSKILAGSVKLSFHHISNLATNLNMSEIDILTYPEILFLYLQSEPYNKPIRYRFEINTNITK